MALNSIANKLTDWNDIDYAQFHLAICLGLISPQTSFVEVKWLFWSNNQIGNSLAEILDKLVEIEALEKRDEPDFQYRWNAEFKLK